MLYYYLQRYDLAKWWVFKIFGFFEALLTQLTPRGVTVAHRIGSTGILPKSAIELLRLRPNCSTLHKYLFCFIMLLVYVLSHAFVALVLSCVTVLSCFFAQKREGW